MIDLGIIILIAVSAIYSLFKGMVKEIFSLIAIFSGYFFAGKFSKTLAVYFSPFIQSDVISESFSFLIIFFVVSITVKIIGSFIKKTLKISKTLSLADRSVGGIIGVIKGGIIISVIMIPLAFIPKLKAKILNESKLSPFFMQTSKILTKQLSSGNIFKGSSQKAKKLLKTLEKQFGSNITSKLGDLEGFNLDGIDLDNLDLSKLDLNNLPKPNTDLSKEDQKQLERLLKKISK